jgi:putative ABC transport system ATP-binding protein
LLLADEPTASLDRASGRLVIERISETVRTTRCGVLISTHDDRIMDVATTRIQISDGMLLPATAV